MELSDKTRERHGFTQWWWQPLITDAPLSKVCQQLNEHTQTRAPGQLIALHTRLGHETIQKGNLSTEGKEERFFF